MIDAAIAIDAVVRLIQAIHDWLADEDHAQPVSACATALATMLATQPETRARLIASTHTNHVLRLQLLALCNAYVDRFPVFADVKKEIDNAAG